MRMNNAHKIAFMLKNSATVSAKGSVAAARNNRSIPGLSSIRTAIQTLIHKGITLVAMEPDVGSTIPTIRLIVTTKNLNGIAAYV